MDRKTTLNDLTQFYRNEKEISKLLFGNSLSKLKSEKVSAQTTLNIMNYSKVISIRNSKIMGKIDFILN